MSFDRAAAFVLARETGAITDDPADPGKLTRWGIALARHPELTAGDIRNMTPERARSIYFSDYWMPIHGDQWPDAYSICLLDSAILQGVEMAVRFAQAALYVHVDGIVGPGTLGAARRATQVQPVLARFSAQRIVHLADLPGWPHDGEGWAERVTLAAMQS